MVLTAVYLINRLPYVVLQGKSSFFKLFNNEPDYYFLRVFGCLCFLWLKPYMSSKLEGRSKKCLFLGYSSNTKGYRCLDLSSGRVFICQHVLFRESNLPFSAKQSASSSPSFPILGQDPSNLFSTSAKDSSEGSNTDHAVTSVKRALIFQSWPNFGIPLVAE